MKNRTKDCKFLRNLFYALHFLFMFGPLLYYIPYGLSQGEPVQKVTLVLTLVVVVIIGAISLMSDIKHRAGLHKSCTWLLMLGILFCLKQVETFIYIFAICSLFDELIFIRLKDRYAELYRTNREIDRRG